MTSLLPQLSVLYVGFIINCQDILDLCRPVPNQVIQAGMGCKPLPANFGVLIAFVCMVIGMWFTVMGRFQLILFLNTNKYVNYVDYYLKFIFIYSISYPSVC